MTEFSPHKVFTLEEANHLLVRLTPLLEELRGRRDAILALEVEIDALEIISPSPGAADDQVSPAVNAKVEEYTRAVNRFYALVESIHETGCLLKDVDLGLVDFYSLRDGREVFLCWKVGEPKVSYWHEVGLGFSNRQPLNPENL